MSDTAAGTTKRVFVVGCRRSGTTWVTMLLSHHPGAAGIQQSSFFERVDNLANWIDEQVKYGRTVLTADQSAGDDRAAGLARQPLGSVVTMERFYHHMRPLAEEVYGQIAECAPDALAAVDHHPENVRYWKHILQVFPDAWFVHVVRDPRSVFSSYRHAALSFSSSNIFTTDAIEFAEEWTREVSKGRAIADATDRYIEIRYEAMRENGAEELLRLFEKLGLPADLELSQRAIDACSMDKLKQTAHGPKGFFRKGEVAGWQRELSRAQVEIVEYGCEPLMAELGYERTTPGGDKPRAVRVHERRRQTRDSWRQWAAQGDGVVIRSLRKMGKTFPRARKFAWRLLGQ